MSWLFSRVLVEEFSEAICSDGELFVQSNGSPIPQAYCAPDKMKAFSRVSRFGMTFGPLTEDRGEELLTWFRAGFPVKTFAAAGKGAGIDGERSGMWTEMARIIREVRPRFVFVENSPMLTSRGLDRVLGDLASLGFDAEWGVLGAADVGAPHQRDRIWIVAYSNSLRKLQSEGDEQKQRRWTSDCGQEMAHPNNLDWRPRNEGRQAQTIGGEGLEQSCGSGENVAYSNGPQFQRGGISSRIQSEDPNACRRGWWATEPELGRVANGVACRVDRLKAIGNGQVSEVARRAFGILRGRL
jgi:DNA (cytosine-5)-methyltransferase 1